MESNTSIIVLARKGSKRLPGKNMKLLNGIPLIQHTFEFIHSLGFKYPKYIVSDDQDILDLGVKHGFKSIVEPDKYATDNGGNMEFMKWVHKQIRSNFYIMLPATFPIRNTNRVKRHIKDFMSSTKESCFTVSKASSKLLVLNGNLYIWHKNQLEKGFIYDHNSLVLIDEKGIDIDTIEDFELCEKELSNEN